MFERDCTGGLGHTHFEFKSKCMFVCIVHYSHTNSVLGLEHQSTFFVALWKMEKCFLSLSSHKAQYGSLPVEPPVERRALRSLLKGPTVARGLGPLTFFLIMRVVIHRTVTTFRMIIIHASGAEHVTFLKHISALLKILPAPVICAGFSSRFQSDPNCLMICFSARALPKKPFSQVTKSTLSRQHCLICEAGLPQNRLRYCPILSALGFRGHSSCLFINTASES